ncbi:Alpha/Beta hydrolase protein [Roridomyces roridus]|uniref:acylaminoacyl-peptidase n=1 Tax=Roridomyces roridus TaxID=1738132 RepID=A0AAD7BKR7_9AGAR|nr:Alpha/Beta hydrolase protein [Roridomyces roridus]
MPDNTFQRVGALPTYSDARFIAPGVVEASISCRSYETYTTDRFIQVGRDGLYPVPAILFSPSPDASCKAIFHEDGVTLWLELCSSTGVSKLQLQSIHGKIYMDPSFGPLGGPHLAWNSEGTQFLYVAETLDSTNDYIPDFGDALLDKKRPGVFLCDVPSLTVRLVVAPEPDGSVAFGQPVFVTPTTFVAVGYSALDDGRRTGLIYCQNRLARLYHFDLSNPGAKIPLTPEDRSVRSPRVGHGFLAFISNKQAGPHGSCAQLHVRRLPLDLSVSFEDVLVPTVVHVSDSEFPGVYLDQLPAEPFLIKDNVPHLALSSEWRSRTVPLLVSLETKTVTNLAPCPTAGLVQPEALMSYTVFRANSVSCILATRSSLSRPSELVMYDVKNTKGWVTLNAPPPQEFMAPLAVATIAIPQVHATEIIVVSASPKIKRILAELAVAGNCVYAGPTSENDDDGNAAIPPVVHIPHGGPHMHSSTKLWAHWTSLAIAGFTVVLINYTGSTGFGLEAVEALFGHVGDVDVKSLHASYEYLLRTNLASANPGKQFIEGLSHGGFLTHCTYDIPFSGLDIPEWGPNEVRLFEGREAHAALPIRLASGAEYELLAGASPIHRVDDVTAPTLVLLSADDRRVRPSQGLAWYHGLKRNGRARVACKMFRGEIHALDGVEAEWKAWQESITWYASIVK